LGAIFIENRLQLETSFKHGKRRGLKQTWRQGIKPLSQNAGEKRTEPACLANDSAIFPYDSREGVFVHTTSLRKVGGSVMLTVPPVFLDQLHLQAGAVAGLAISDGRLVIEPAPRPRYTLDELLAEAEASGAYPLPPEEREWVDASAVGRESI
jgi:antitoxin ChpS